MPKFTEDTLNIWRMPPSDTEDTKLSNAERMIREAIANDDKLNKLSYEIYGQGSYANDTNVRLNSDIDINIRLLSTIYVDVPVGKSSSDYGYSDSNYKFAEYKTDVFNALVKYFGSSEVKRKDKCIEIKGNSYRVQADVVPTFKYIRHFENGIKREGAKFISDTIDAHQNFALQHIESGKKKNLDTSKRFKRLVRIFKRVRYKMIEDGIIENSNITSFLLESLLWNVPSNIYNENLTWTERLRQSIIYIYNQTKDIETCKGWTEISECLYLFHSQRKWSVYDVNQFMIKTWNYLEFS
ncbi:nucleotidyltransferase domain-containing protein [Ferruginibacter sp. SUN002]|uniref:nucleotidyltransferase domain-containing protein n=1 Tax=Ferruginibacter sp. SUN002 TaxID=2937789 RepID=UPI003D363266